MQLQMAQRTPAVCGPSCDGVLIPRVAAQGVQLQFRCLHVPERYLANLMWRRLPAGNKVNVVVWHRIPVVVVVLVTPGSQAGGSLNCNFVTRMNRK